MVIDDATAKDLTLRAAKACDWTDGSDCGWVSFCGLFRHNVHGVPHCGYDDGDVFDPLREGADTITLMAKCRLSVKVIPDGCVAFNANGQEWPPVNVEAGADNPLEAAIRLAVLVAAADHIYKMPS